MSRTKPRQRPLPKRRACRSAKYRTRTECYPTRRASRRCRAFHCAGMKRYRSDSFPFRLRLRRGPLELSRLGPPRAECFAPAGAATSVESPFRLTPSALFRFAQATNDNAIAQTARSGRRERVLVKGKRGQSLRLVLGIMSHTPWSPDFQIVPSAERPLKDWIASLKWHSTRFYRDICRRHECVTQILC